MNRPEFETASQGDSWPKPLAAGLYSAESHARLSALLGEAACQTLGIFPIPDDFLLSVVMPIHNEQATLETIVERVRAVPIRKEILLVDDGSTDNTRDILSRLAERSDPWNAIVVVSLPTNRGKGAALRQGFLQSKGNAVLVQDADLEYNPGDYPRLLLPLLQGEADVVFGSRFRGDHPHRVLYFWHYVGNKLITLFSNCVTNLNCTDIETGYKVFRGDLIRALAPELQQQRFGIEPELTCRAARRGWRVFEVSIGYSGRTYAQGKKVRWHDGLQALWCILRYGWF